MMGLFKRLFGYFSKCCASCVPKTSNRIIMKRTTLVSISLFTFFFSFSQQQNKISYKQLKEYEGVYDYAGHLKVSFAASPKDTALVAIINQSEYVLKNESPDVFSTRYDTIRFLRDSHNVPSAYISKKYF